MDAPDVDGANQERGQRDRLANGYALVVVVVVVLEVDFGVAVAAAAAAADVVEIGCKLARGGWTT